MDVDGIIACQEVGNGALSKSTHQILGLLLMLSQGLFAGGS